MSVLGTMASAITEKPTSLRVVRVLAVWVAARSIFVAVAGGDRMLLLWSIACCRREIVLF